MTRAPLTAEERLREARTLWHRHGEFVEGCQGCAMLAELEAATLDVERAARAPEGALQALVNEQAEDEGLWFIAQTAPEAYLQQELRRLHAVVEAARAEPGLREALANALGVNGIAVENVASTGNADQWLPDYELVDRLLADPGVRAALRGGSGE